MNYSTEDKSAIDPEQPINTTFLKDVINGLSAPQKYLDAKYFYNEKGDSLFQKIMNAPEYYLTDCELEILSGQASRIVAVCCEDQPLNNVVELGAGDASKSIFLLQELAHRNKTLHYFPVDISANIIDHLIKFIPEKVPDINVTGLQGDYFAMLSTLSDLSTGSKLVLFLGSTIGNMSDTEMKSFLRQLNSLLQDGDMLLTGFDLVKDPAVTLSAYDDAGGFTKAFNLNLLDRINAELHADFNPKFFSHVPVYNRQTNTCESYLVSQKEQKVTLHGHRFHFDKGETIFMEISHKFHPEEVDVLARTSGFIPVHCFFDQKRWFMDALWKKGELTD